MRPNVIGLYSPSSGHGKDTVAKLFLSNTLNLDERYRPSFKQLIAGHLDHILEYSPWTVRKFAEGPKKIVADIYNVPVKKLEDRDWRIQIHSPFDISPLHMVIKVAETLRKEVGKTIWSEQLFNSYDVNSKWIISDLRFPHEYEAIKKHGGIIIKVIRPECDEPKQALDGLLDEYEFDECIENIFGDYWKMVYKVLDIIKKYQMIYDGE